MHLSESESLKRTGIPPIITTTLLPSIIDEYASTNKKMLEITRSISIFNANLIVTNPLLDTENVSIGTNDQPIANNRRRGHAQFS